MNLQLRKMCKVTCDQELSVFQMLYRKALCNDGSTEAGLDPKQCWVMFMMSEVFTDVNGTESSVFPMLYRKSLFNDGGTEAGLL